MLASCQSLDRKENTNITPKKEYIMTQPELALYMTPTCPFCRKVIHFIEENHLNIPLKNVDADSNYRDELVTIGGKGQVPCLFIDGKALYESDAIIEWMRANLT